MGQEIRYLSTRFKYVTFVKYTLKPLLFTSVGTT